MSNTQLPVDVEKRFDENFTEGDFSQCTTVHGGEYDLTDSPSALKQFIAQELSQAVQAERNRLIEAVQIIDETFEVENDGELILINKEVTEFKEEVIKALTQESK
jgi:hypothetical protein